MTCTKKATYLCLLFLFLFVMAWWVNGALTRPYDQDVASANQGAYLKLSQQKSPTNTKLFRQFGPREYIRIDTVMAGSKR